MTDWNKLKVVDLKAELKKRGLPQTGLKPALVARLAAAETEDGSESEATIQDDAVKVNLSSATSPDTASQIQPSSEGTAEAFLEAPGKLSEAEPKSIDQGSAPETVESPSQPLSAQPLSTAGSVEPPRRDDNDTSARSAVERREVAEDRQKRKRRSQSPPPAAEDISRKRVRQVDDAESDKDNLAAEGDGAGKTAAVGVPTVPDPKITNVAREEGNVNAVTGDSTGDGGKRASSLLQDMEVESQGNLDVQPAQISSDALEGSISQTRDSRFKDLFSAPQKASQAMAIERTELGDDPIDTVQVEPDRAIAPAIHPATSAIYIRDFMRPLNPLQLKSHLATLATPRGQDPDPDIILRFYLDPIRTHAFISFTNVSAASRVRSALHDRIWPDERNRKPLWADFIPSEKVEEWVEEEESANTGGRAGGRKWEICYTTDQDRQVTATLEEVGAGPRPQPIRKPSVAIAPSGPLPSRGVEGAPSGPRAVQIRGQRAATNLSTLDQLFKSTTAKPVLYWQPVSKSLADWRLERIDNATSKDASRRVLADIHRYTFEDGDVLVDRGPEIFSGIRPPPGHRGPRGGGRGGGGGGYQGRGGYQDRAYDSYRSDRRESRDRRY